MKTGFILFTSNECRKNFLKKVDIFGSFQPIGNPEPLVVFSISDSDLFPVIAKIADQCDGTLQQRFKPARL